MDEESSVNLAIACCTPLRKEAGEYTDDLGSWAGIQSPSPRQRLAKLELMLMLSPSPGARVGVRDQTQASWRLLYKL
jgi:hypothetical protein